MRRPGWFHPHGGDGGDFLRVQPIGSSASSFLAFEAKTQIFEKIFERKRIRRDLM